MNKNKTIVKEQKEKYTDSVLYFGGEVSTSSISMPKVTLVVVPVPFFLYYKLFCSNIMCCEAKRPNRYYCTVQ
jgi:hypothetical protein